MLTILNWILLIILIICIGALVAFRVYVRKLQDIHDGLGEISEKSDDEDITIEMKKK